MKKQIDEIASRKAFAISNKEKVIWASLFISGVFLLASIIAQQFGQQIQAFVSTLANK